MHVKTTTVYALCYSLGLLLLAGCATAEQVPSLSPDGLKLQPNSKFSAVYIKPGASLDGYKVFGITDCQVAFRKNWQRDQNMDRMDLDNMVTKRDVDRIKQRLGKQCTQAIRTELELPPPYTLVDQFTSDEQVLILRPAIINLDIAAPDTMNAGMSQTYTTSAGEMTIVLELIDGTTSDVLARVYDKFRDADAMQLQWSNSVTNQAAADRALKQWSQQIRAALDHVMDR